MLKTNLGSMSVEELLQLRDDVGKELNRKSTELRSQLARLGGEIASSRARGSSLKGKKVPAKYRDKAGNTWAGRGAKPRWLVAAIKEGRSWKILRLKRLQGNVERKRNNIIGQDGEIQGTSLEGLSGIYGVLCRFPSDLRPRSR